MATPTTIQATSTSSLQRRPFYIGASLLMGLIAVVGFWPTYFGPLVKGTIAQPLLIHIHATVFTGWLVLFLTQAVLAATKQVTWHLRLGKIGIGYGDRKSTRLNSSHSQISYAVFCLKKKSPTTPAVKRTSAAFAMLTT